MAQTQLGRPARTRPVVNLRVLLAALPFVGIYSGGTLASHMPMLFGVPFLLVWNLIWMAGTATILAVIYFLDSRDEAARMSNKAEGEQ